MTDQNGTAQGGQLVKSKPAPPPPPKTRVSSAITNMESKFADALPQHMGAQTFVRYALLALDKPTMAPVMKTEVGRQSVYSACLHAAADGLMLDGRDSALVPFKSKVKDPVTGRDEWIDQVQYMPMVHGIMKKARNSGEIGSIFCQLVYENDIFKMTLVTEGPPITHEPALADRGEIIGAYSCCRFHDGTWSQPEWMNKEDIIKIQNRSKSGATNKTDRNGKPIPPRGPWATDWPEMARKTVLKRAAKYWPSSSDKDGVDLRAMLDRDNDQYAIDAEATEVANPQIKKSAAAAILSAPVEESEEEAPVEASGEVIEEPTVQQMDAANEAAAAAVTDGVAHDPQTGEVIEAEVVTQGGQPNGQQAEPEMEDARI
ncbi:MAG: recombinase RecT [Pseudomonadota bacterium]